MRRASKNFSYLRSIRARLIVVTLQTFKRSIAAILLSLLTPTLPGAMNDRAADSSGCTLRIHVDGLRNSNGVVGSVLFTSADGWPENVKKAFRSGPTPIEPGERQATVRWEHLRPGEYAVAAIHDENRNAKLDRNFIGIPKEGFGFANNPHVGLSAPAFQSAVIRVQCPITDTSIHLQYR